MISTILDVIRWILASALALVWLAFASWNAWSFLISLGFGRPRPRYTWPLIGGLAGALAMVLCPLPGSSLWLWVPLVLDAGCIPVFSLLWWEARRERRSRAS